MILSLILSTLAFAGGFEDQWGSKIDMKARDLVKWEDTRLAGKLSDGTLAVLVGGTLAYTVIHNKDRADRWERVGGVALGYAVNLGSNTAAKYIFGRCRPDDCSDRLSHWSGHTSTAFASAGAICLQSSRELCAAALLAAGSVGYFRMAANKHWLTDVTVGAGLGYVAGRYVPTMVVKGGW